MKKKIWMLRPILIVAELILIAFTVLSYFFSTKVIFYAELIGTIIFLIVTLPIVIGTQRELHRFMDFMGKELSTTERRTLTQFPLPVAVTDGEGTVLWYNNLFRHNVIDNTEIFGSPLEEISEDFSRERALTPEGVTAVIEGKVFTILGVESPMSDKTVVAYYFVDRSAEHIYKRVLEDTRPAVVHITLDNFEDLLSNSKESERSRVIGEVERLFEDFGSENHCFLKKVGYSRFVAIIEEKYLQSVIEGRFSILDGAREIVTFDNLPVTLSIGVGRGDFSLPKLDAMAAQALEMSLGRGGDQAAVKDATGFEFYGGFSKAIEKRTKVKTRLVAKALSELIESSRNVLIMGHRMGDMDCAGAAVGMYSACTFLNKSAYIVTDKSTTLALPLIESVDPGNEKGVFISPETALMQAGEDTLLIIVDTHIKHILESPELYDACKNIVVIDHHRKMVGHIENAVIFYHEPNASSACEMVTELLQYFGDGCAPTKEEAGALLAGIMLDTKSFAMRSGVRTFEAAAWLRKMGADTVKVKKLFADKMETYRHRAAVVAKADIYRGCAIAFCDKYSDVVLVAPQAADELLSISGVVASFVLYQTDSGISISARSLGAFNVQIIMEAMGGGGHQTMAGAQLRGTTPGHAHTALINAIDDYIEKSEGHNTTPAKEKEKE